MGEIDAIETLIDTLVALDLDSLAGINTARAARISIAALLVAYTDGDVDGLASAAVARAEMINALDCVEKLIDSEAVYHAKRG